jgi:hypothetical protein
MFAAGGSECDLMFFMVIEKFRPGNAKAVYARVREGGRKLPEGLRYVDSWVEASLSRCFQLMECDDPRLFQEWVALWEDLVDFEIVPVVLSKQAAETIRNVTSKYTESGNASESMERTAR